MSLSRARADIAAEQLRTLAQPQRLMILAALLDGERAVGELEAATGIVQPALSQQLAELRRTALVATRREARQIHYRISTEEVEERVRALFAVFGALPAPARATSAGPGRPAVSARTQGAATFARIG